MKYGAPKTAVITPTGTSEGAIIVLLMESQKIINIAPSTIDAGKSLLCEAQKASLRSEAL